MDLKGVIQKLTNANIKTPFKNKKETGGFKIAVSSGLYYVARADEINTLVKKTGYALTRGAGAVEIAADIPHEINFSEGKDVRYISEKMDVDMLLHGDLQAPFEMPDRTEWLITQNKLEKCIKSGIYGGCKYVNFHSCLREWLELFTYAGQRLEIVMCDHRGFSIGRRIFKDEDGGVRQNGQRLREWFCIEPNIYNKNDFAIKWAQAILDPREYDALQREIEVTTMNRLLDQLVDRANENQLRRLIGYFGDQIRDELEIRGIFPNNPNFQNEIQQIFNRLLEDREEVKRRLRNTSRVAKQQIFDSNIHPDFTFNTLSRGIQQEYRSEVRRLVGNALENGREWYLEERVGSLEDAYLIMAHYLFFNQDPLWITSTRLYEDVMANFGYDINNPPLDLREDRITRPDGSEAVIFSSWLDRALKRVKDTPDEWSLKFKEFYYGVVAAKYLQGHVFQVAQWMADQQNGLRKIISREIESVGHKDKEKEKKKLFEILENFLITFEVPDARNPEFGGRYMLWRPKQILAAVMHIRQELEKIKNSYHDKIFMIIDWEHVATQGVDPYDEATDLIKSTNKLNIEVGDYIIGIHANYPSPLQPHKPIDIADRIVIYELLWKLRQGGLGKKHVVYLLFERGGGDDPFRGSVIALRTIAEQLLKDTEPDKLPETFFAISEGTRDWARQRVHIFQHAFEPLKGQLKSPEEEHTLLSSAALKAGKRPEEWLKEELR